MGVRRLLLATSTANISSACRRRARRSRPVPSELCFDYVLPTNATCRSTRLSRRPVPLPRPIRNGFPANSPYNADLPYVIKQKALFGEASYKFNQFKLTAGGRWYDFKRTRDFVSGGLFSTAAPTSATRPSRTASRRASSQLGAQPQPQRQPPGGQGIPPRRHQRSAERAAVHARRTCATFGGLRHLQGRDAVELRSRRQIFEARLHLQFRRLPQRDPRPAGHADRGQLLVARRLQRAQGAFDRHRSRAFRAPAARPRFVVRRQRAEREVRFDGADRCRRE